MSTYIVQYRNPFGAVWTDNDAEFSVKREALRRLKYLEEYWPPHVWEHRVVMLRHGVYYAIAQRGAVQ